MRRCACDFFAAPILGETARVITVKRFKHPYLPSKTVVATVDDFWQVGDVPVANPFMVIIDTPLWPWPGEVVPGVLNSLGKMLGDDPSRLALRVTDGRCAFHGDEDVRQPALLSRMM